ncbi:hypothetical protein LCGC14_0439400 [marine sediment metagenome]|uniref:Major facilitator superfamily (MFS) profile domain-containing protein n=1 Tax=marine sediment metagenome TaxID=412755 RepID=A0A0F9T436_9ZZZZ
MISEIKVLGLFELTIGIICFIFVGLVISELIRNFEWFILIPGIFIFAYGILCIFAWSHNWRKHEA